MRRWATTGCPPAFIDAVDYDRRIRRLVGVGATSDVAVVGWYARLSEIHPTLEVRVADAQLSLAPTLLLAALIRALVVTALSEAERDAALIRVEPEMLDAALWHASRDGIRGELLDPFVNELQSARVVTDKLVRYVEEALEVAGDRHRVADLLEQLWGTGTGAEQQRLIYSARGMPGLSKLLEFSFTSDATP